MRPFYERIVLEEQPEVKGILEGLWKLAREAAAKAAPHILGGDEGEDGRAVLKDILGAWWQPDAPELPEDWDPRVHAIGNNGVSFLLEALLAGKLPKTMALFTGALEKAILKKIHPSTSAYRDVFMSTKVDMLSAWIPGEDWISPGYHGHSNLIYNLDQFVALYMEDYGNAHSLTFNFTDTRDVHEAIEYAGKPAIEESLWDFEATFLKIFYKRLAAYVDLSEALTSMHDVRWTSEWSEVTRYGKLGDAREELLAHIHGPKRSLKGPSLGALPEDWDPRYKGRDPREGREMIMAWLESHNLLEYATVWNKELRYEKGKLGYPGTAITIVVSGPLRYMFDHPEKYGQWLEDWKEFLGSLGYEYGRNGSFKNHIEIDEIDRPTNTGWSK